MSEVELPKLAVVAGIIRNDDNLYLVAQRPITAPYPGKWEFPGGKIEPGETAFEALKRELWEEIGVEVHEAVSFMRFDHPYPNRIIDLHVWQILKYSGEPYGKENQLLKWLQALDLPALPFHAANYRVIENLT